MKSETPHFPDRFRIPPFLHDWIDRFFEPADIDIGQAFAESPEKAANRFSASALDRAFRRGILRKTEYGRFELADFHSRFEIWALFEGWKDVPERVRNQLNAWELDSYIEHIVGRVERLKSGGERVSGEIYPTYLLLHEAETVIDRAPTIFLWPCNCRAMMRGCKGDLYTCLRFDNSRDIGWEISRERAMDIIRGANRRGLMQSGEIGVAPDGRLLGAICNCCADCCYPHQAARRLEAETFWPETRYIARYMADRCTGCGRCVRRCPFDAFEISMTSRGTDGRKDRKIRFHSNRCRGCGLCAAGCVDEAIIMERTGRSIEAILDAGTTFCTS